MAFFVRPATGRRKPEWALGGGGRRYHHGYPTRRITGDEEQGRYLVDVDPLISDTLRPDVEEVATENDDSPYKDQCLKRIVKQQIVNNCAKR
jgi:hypothetical protein